MSNYGNIPATYSNKLSSGGYGACFLAGCRKGTELFKARELNVFDKAMA